MIDQIHILVQAGDGGHGCESFFRRTDRKNVPNGGNGGHGGNIVFRAEASAPAIAQFQFKRHVIAESGGHGGSNKKRGRNGKDLVFAVPVGTTLRNRSRNLVIRESMAEGEEVIVVAGGQGGSGNAGGKTMTEGQRGEIMDLEISMRIQTDICLVGLPNAGKSALLNALTGTHARVELYPFTTASPEIGVCNFLEFERLTLCEIPSVYSASHEGRGLGNDFLKHLEYAWYLLYVIDAATEFAPSLEAGFRTVQSEIARYDKRFGERPAALVVTKMDLAESRKKIAENKWRPDIPVFHVSVETGEGLDELKKFLEELANRHERAKL